MNPVSLTWQVQEQSEHMHLDSILKTPVPTMPEKPTYEELEKRIHDLEQVESERDKALEALRESEKRYRGLFETIADAVMVFDLKTRSFLEVNEAATKMYGYGREEFLGLQYDSVAAGPDARDHATEQLEPGRKIQSAERLHRKKDGSVFPVEITGSALDLNGKKFGFHVVRDIAGRKMVEQKIRSKNEALFRGLFDNMTSGSAIYEVINDGSKGSDYIIRGFNNTSLKIEGKTLDQVLGKSLHDLRPNIDEYGLIPVLKKVWKTGKPAFFPVKIYQDQNFSNYYENHVFKIPTGEVVTIYNDVTEQQNAKNALKHSKERFEFAMEFANDGLFDWNLATGEIYYSPVWKSLLGYRDDEIENEFSAWERLTRPEDVKASWAMLDDVLAGRRDRFEMEFQMLHKDGHHVDILSRANVIFDEKGKAVRVVGTHVDITERKKAEKEVLRQKQTAERYLNLAGVMFIGLDFDGNVNLTNRQARRILECDKADIVGKNWFDNFIPANIREDVRAVFKKLLDGKIEPVEYYENPVVTKSGREKIIAWHNTYISNDNGEIVGILGSGEDITDKRMLEARLRKAQKMESIGNLAGGIAHDFNNLLFPIIGMSEMLLEDLPDNSPEHENAFEILKAGKRGSDLVKQILAFSRQSEHRKIPVRIQHVLKEVYQLCRSTIPSNIEISRDIQPDCGLAMADPTQLHQVAMNLVTNAYHSLDRHDGGKIAIRLRETVLSENDLTGSPLQPGSYATLEVSDNGCGIDPAILDKIFEPYFTTKERGKGTGLGLAVVYGIVREHGGDVQASSEVDKGTTFTVFFPLMERTSRIVPEKTAGILQGGSERILVVDDEGPIAKLQKLMLERLGYQVKTHTGSMDALNTFRENPGAFDIVVTDMTMPNMTGDRLARELISIRPDLPVVICTGFSERIDDQKAKSMGIKAFLMKPVVQAEIARTVRKVLDEAKCAAQG